MWTLVKLDTNLGEFVHVSSFSTSEAALEHKEHVNEDHFILFSGDLPDSNEGQRKIFAAVKEMNGDKVSRLIIGAEISQSSNKSEKCNCPGRCFCVIWGSGASGCYAYYCDRHGYCWEVRCYAN